MLVTLKQVLHLAQAENKAVGAFNVPNLASVRAVLAAAEQLGEPVILQFAQLHEDIMPLSVIGPILLQLGDDAAVPVCVHLDHGVTLPYLDHALKLGFTSIMLDGSALSYEENCAYTATAVEMAARYGASVEAEIGVVGTSGVEGEGIYTDPGVAREFVERTGIDALACAFGTVHGLYLEKPKLDFDLLATIRDTVEVPLVMHGGSGISEEDYHKCIKRGIRKINYFTYMTQAGGRRVREKLETAKVAYYHEIATWGFEGMKEDVVAAIGIFSQAHNQPEKPVQAAT